MDRKTTEDPSTSSRQVTFGGHYAAVAIVDGKCIELHGASAVVVGRFAKDHPGAWQRDSIGWHRPPG